MKRDTHPLLLVASVLRGSVPDESRWPAIVDIANRGWVTPALYVALERSGRLQEVPETAREYLALLHDRNVERNRRLRSQLVEALRALNGAGIRPILLKGAITLFTGEDASVRSRLMSDLDIAIAPAELAETKAALAKLGYYEMDTAYNMARSDDVGVISLHDKPNPRSRHYLSGDPGASAPLVERDGVTARVPTPTAHAVHLLVHDMIKEGDLWRLRINLRHLCDLVELTAATNPIDWNGVAEVLGDDVGRRAIAVQLLALRDLFAMEVPAHLCGGALDKLTHKARVQAANRGISGSVVRVAGRLLWGYRRFRESYTWRGGGDFARRVRQNMVAPAKGSTL